MKKDDLNLLREIQKNTEMGMQALELLSSKVYDDSFAMQLSRESFKYGELHEKAKAEMIGAKHLPEPENRLKRMMLAASIQGNTLFDSTTGHLAEMMIRGSNMGLTSLWKTLNHNAYADGRSVELAKELMDFEENNIRELKKYL